MKVCNFVLSSLTDFKYINKFNESNIDQFQTV